MSALTVYTLAQCSTCRDATRWLKARGVAFVEKPIRETPPSEAELRQVLAASGLPWRRLFNTSGIEYRALGMAAKLPDLSEAAALRLLAGNGSLVKRPLVVGKGVGLVGFKVDAWAQALGA